MYLKNSGLIRLLIISMALTVISGCSTTMSNVGRKSVKIERIAIIDQKSDNQLWQTDRLSINYSTESSKDTFAISGSVHIKSSVTLSFPRAKYFYLFLNFIDENGIALSSHDISPLVRYRNDVDLRLPFNFSLERPDRAVSFAFSYIGKFIGAISEGEDMGDWEIYYRPFTKVP